jgi:hypothetical protein
MADGAGLLSFLRVHQEAVNAILESTPAGDERMRRLNASEEFLMEALSLFEMTTRGYLEILTTKQREHQKKPGHGGPQRRT